MFMKKLRVYGYSNCEIEVLRVADWHFCPYSIRTSLKTSSEKNMLSVRG